MAVYLITILIVYTFLFLEIGVKDKKIKLVYFYIGAFLVTFILAFRGDNVGGDTIEYCEYFDGTGSVYGTVDKPNEAFGQGFVWFSQCLRFFSNSRFFFIFSTSLVTILPFIYIICKESKIKLIPLCFYMTSFALLSLSQTCIRQNIGNFFLFLIYILLNKKKSFGRWNYFLVPSLLILAVLCHTTALLTIMLALFVYYMPLSKKYALLVVLCSALLILAVPDFSDVLLGKFYLYFSVVEEADHFTEYMYRTDVERNVGVLSVVPRLVLLGTFILLCSKDQFTRDRLKSFPIKCLVWGGVFTFLSLGFQLGVRIVLFLMFLGVTASPENFMKKKYVIFKIGFLTMLVTMAVRQIYYLAFVESAILYDQLVPYYFIFEK